MLLSLSIRLSKYTELNMASGNVDGEICAVSSKFKWVIDLFCMGCKNVGDQLKSPIFTTTSIHGNIQWFMVLYPKGRSEKFKDYFSLYVFSLNDVTADVILELINNNGSAALSLSMKRHFSKNGWGYKDFTRRTLIYNSASKVLNDDKITIVCKITLSDKKKPGEEKLTPEKEKTAAVSKNVLQRLAEMDKYELLINDDKFSDISLISEGKEVKGHKCILAKSSSVFATMFDIDMKEKQLNTVEITDIKYDVLVEMIRFVYTGKVNNIDALASELAEAADKYELDVLKNMCETAM